MNEKSKKQFISKYKLRNGSTKNSAKAWKRLVNKIKYKILKKDLKIRERMARDGIKS